MPQPSTLCASAHATEPLLELQRWRPSGTDAFRIDGRSARAARSTSLGASHGDDSTGPMDVPVGPVWPKDRKRSKPPRRRGVVDVRPPGARRPIPHVAQSRVRRVPGLGTERGSAVRRDGMERPMRCREVPESPRTVPSLSRRGCGFPAVDARHPRHSVDLWPWSDFWCKSSQFGATPRARLFRPQKGAPASARETA